MAQFFEDMSTVPMFRRHVLAITGVDGAAPVVRYGKGMTVTRTGEGAYTVTWTSNPGHFVGWSCSFGADTPGDVKTYTASRDTYSASSGLPIVFYNSGTAADLIETEYADIVFFFTESSAA